VVVNVSYSSFRKILGAAFSLGGYLQPGKMFPGYEKVVKKRHLAILIKLPPLTVTKMIISAD